jgi:hypothetical protein
MKSKYYLVTENENVQYIKIESDLSFSIQEGIEQIKKTKPKAIIKYIAKSKAKNLLKLDISNK